MPVADELAAFLVPGTAGGETRRRIIGLVRFKQLLGLVDVFGLVLLISYVGVNVRKEHGPFPVPRRFVRNFRIQTRTVHMIAFGSLAVFSLEIKPDAACRCIAEVR